jgi:S-adenosylmethionine hydrolase
VLWVDRFGNAQLNVEWPGGLAPGAEAGAPVEVQTATGRITVRTVFAYGQLEPGEVGLVVDSYRMLTLALNGASAAGHLALQPGQAVWLAVNDLAPR